MKQREIKFELLTKNIQGEWCKNSDGFYLDGKGNLWVIDDFDNWLPNPFKEEDFVLRQYTGLKDKNGKEIWEGDIVEYETLSSKGGLFGKTRNEVKFIRGYFELVPYEDKRWGGYQNLEVIGNIYENPELLKK